nr:thrombospondin type 3 repeat-containing protein [Deltaproteobacteria bacterium]
MRKLTLTLAIAIPALMAGTAGAQDAGMTVTSETTTTTEPGPGPGKVEFGLFTGGFISNYYHQFFSYEFESRRQELNQLSPLFGVRLAVFPSRYIGLEVEGSVIHAETEMTSHNVTIFGLLGQIMIQRPGRFTPFLALGASSRLTVSNLHGDDTDRPIHAGIGFRIFATNTVAIRVDGRFLRGPSQQDPFTLNASYGELMVGLSFNPTSSRSVTTVREEDQDPDRDGVLGMNDACPTEAGTNPDGCPTRDQDGDGIMDPADKCPAEAETVNAFQDEDGCPDTLPDTD